MFKIFHKMIEKVQDMVEGVVEFKQEVPQYVRQQRARWGLNKNGDIALIGYYCVKANRNCDWFGSRCKRCCNN